VFLRAVLPALIGEVSVGELGARVEHVPVDLAQQGDLFLALGELGARVARRQLQRRVPVLGGGRFAHRGMPGRGLPLRPAPSWLAGTSRPSGFGEAEPAPGGRSMSRSLRPQSLAKRSSSGIAES